MTTAAPGIPRKFTFHCAETVNASSFSSLRFHPSAKSQSFAVYNYSRHLESLCKYARPIQIL